MRAAGYPVMKAIPATRQEAVGMDKEVRARWIEAARLVMGGTRDGIRCPEHQDGFLEVIWAPFRDQPGGEYWLRCPVCGAHNEVLVKSDPGPPHSGAT